MHISTQLLSQIYWLLVVTAIALVLLLSSRVWDSYEAIVASGGCALLLYQVRRTLLRRFRPHLYQPLKEKQLRRSNRKYFQHVTSELEQVGFTPLGDYLLQADPGRAEARFLLSRGGKCLASIFNVYQDCYFEFESVCADGTLFCTHNLPLEMSADARVPLDFLSVPGCDLLGNLQTHIKRVKQYEEQSGVSVLEIEPENFLEVADYGHRLSCHDCYLQGLKSEAPPPLERPGLVVDGQATAVV